MSATTNVADQMPNSSKSVDASLWWDSFTDLLSELENLSLSHDLPTPLAAKLKDNHGWFLDTVSRFKPPNQKSREVLEAKQLNVGSHKLSIVPELKEIAIKISPVLFLDEVQSYILVKRSSEHNNLAVSSIPDDLFHMVILQYYIERQCLLKCVRQILVHALYVGSGSDECQSFKEEAKKLVSDGLETRLSDVLQELLSSSYPERMDVDLFSLWAEETLMEDNLVLDILFLAYYESFCTCNGSQWKKLCTFYQGIISGSCNFAKLAISTEAINSINYAKVQLLVILIETLDLESILQMLHDEMPFRQSSIPFSLNDIQEMDAIISSVCSFETKEAGSLIMAWAVFLCLILSLPEREENNVLLEINHVGYVGQAFESSSLMYYLEILQCSLLKDSDGPVAGYRCVLRTFVSAFIASYEISIQLEDNIFKSILDILCEIYRGEETLCTQFWDKNSFIDGPIRCLLCNLEGEFPYRTLEFVHLLSALSVGSWPAECVYTFLTKSVGLSTLFEIIDDSNSDGIPKIVETSLPLSIPGYEGLIIPEKTIGRVLKMIDGNTALVRWEYKISGFFVLLLRLAQRFYLDNTEEVYAILDLLCQLVTFNEGICYSLMDTGNFLHDKATNECIENFMSINTVEVVCALVKSLPLTSTVTMALGVNILTKLLSCSPCNISKVALKGSVFDVALQSDTFVFCPTGLSSGSWLLFGRLASMLQIDCEHSESCCQMTLSVLDFTMQLVETGVENDLVFNLVIFSLHYVFVNHEFWKYKVKHARWKVTLKVLEVIKKCISMVSYSRKLEEILQGILLSDTSIHSSLFRIVCITSQDLERLYVSRLYELEEIEGFQLCISYVLEIIFSILSSLSKDDSFSVFHQVILSSATKPIPVITAVISLISCFRNRRIQVGAARVLCLLFVIADVSQHYAFGNACFGLDDKQLAEFRRSFKRILSEQSPWNEDRVLAMLKLLTFAACYQPAFLSAVFDLKDDANVPLSSSDIVKPVDNDVDSFEQANLLDAVVHYIKSSQDLLKSNPKVLSSVLNFLKALWQGAVQFTNICEGLKNSEKFWSQLSKFILLIASMAKNESENESEAAVLNLAYRCQCQSDTLHIVAYEMFLQKQLSRADMLLKQSSREVVKVDDSVKAKFSSRSYLGDIFSAWFEEPAWGNLIKSCASYTHKFEFYYRAKVNAGLLALDLMKKVRNGVTGSLSVSLVERIHMLSKKLCNLPAFLELLALYTERGYSEGKKLNDLILSDLYYHLKGELEGREIDQRQFKELAKYLLDSKFLEPYRYKYDDDSLANANDIYLYNAARLRADLGLGLWDLLGWEASKGNAESMLLCLREFNSMVLLSNSKLFALKALILVLSMCYDAPPEKNTNGRMIPEQVILIGIDHVCLCVHSTLDSLSLVAYGNKDNMDFLGAQVELLLHLTRYLDKRLTIPTFLLVLKTCSKIFKVLSDLSHLAGGSKMTKLLLVLVLSSVEVTCNRRHLGIVMGNVTAETLSEASNVSIGLLPILCNYIQSSDHFIPSLTCIDLILKGFSSPSTWLPVVQKHLQLRYIVQKLLDKSFSSVPVVLKFLLTLAQVKEGAEMLLNVGFFASLKVLFSDFSNCSPISSIQFDFSLSGTSNKLEKPQYMWGLGLAVVTAMIHSLGESSLCLEFVDHLIAYLFLEKSHLVSCHLEAPEFPSTDHDKKRARTQKTQTSFSALTETENALMLICALAKHQHQWIKAMRDMDSQLRERVIHFLAFISRRTQRHGEAPSTVAPLLCHPVLKDEFEWYKKPPLIGSRNGWFGLSPFGCKLNPNFSNLLSKASAVIIKDQSPENAVLPPQTLFSDLMAIQIYRITFLLLKFLCLQADAAARRAEDVGFVDIAHFPELPMPDILHCLQDQGIAIVIELCENKLTKVPSEIQQVCILLLQITAMSLHLEFCVSKICGLRPVLGRIEDFSKEIKVLMRVTEGHEYLKDSVISVKQMILFLYPGMLRE